MSSEVQSIGFNQSQKDISREVIQSQTSQKALIVNDITETKEVPFDSESPAAIITCTILFNW